MDSQNNPNEQKAGWTFRPGQEEPSSPAETNNTPSTAGQTTPSSEESINWTASEFIANHKSVGWYVTLFAAIIVIAGGTFLFTGDYISSGVITVVGILFAILASRKPRQLSYGLDSQGISIGNKFYPHSMFKSFTILHEGAIGCINFLPLKRFMPEISIYYPPEEEEKILDVLTASLPNDQRAEQGFDKMMKKIRF